MTEDKNKKISLKKIVEDVKKGVKENIYEKEFDSRATEDFKKTIIIIIGFILFIVIFI